MSDIFTMAAAMHKRPYVLNEGAPPPGYWSNLLNGVGIPDGWKPPPHRVERKSSALADCIGWVGGVPLFSKRAVEVLAEVCGPNTKFHSFDEIKGKPYSLISAVQSADVLDEAHSVVNRSPIGEIISIQSAVFDLDRVATAPPLFCLPGRAHCELFVKKVVPTAVVAAGLVGFQFSDPAQPQLRRIYLGEDINVFPGIKR